MNLLTKIAVGNVRRNLSDFGVYFAALATVPASCIHMQHLETICLP